MSYIEAAPVASLLLVWRVGDYSRASGCFLKSNLVRFLMGFELTTGCLISYHIGARNYDAIQQKA